MARVFPFNGVMPVADRVADVAAPPYDVMSRNEAAQMAEGNPDSFLHVTRSEIDLPAATDPYSRAVYDKARENYLGLKARGILHRDPAASYYVYRLVMEGRAQTGVVVAAAVDDYDADVIKKHEKTRPLKENDRIRHILATGAQTGPVFLTCRATTQLAGLVDTVTAGSPIRDFTADDGVTHRLWRVAEAEARAFTAAFAEIPALYIADGHHRAAGASQVRAQRRGSNPEHSGAEEYNRFLAVVFPSSQLRILAYNRVVQDLNGLTAEAFLNRLRETAAVTPDAPAVPTCKGTCAMYLAGVWYQLRFASSAEGLSVADNLDASILQRQVLEPILGIKDPRTSERIAFVGGIRGTGALREQVDSGEMAVAFSLFPTTLEDLMAVSDAGEIMPPKSTWFEPKLRDAMVIHEI